MALARVGRNALRRSGGSIGNSTNEKAIFYQGGISEKYSLSAPVNANPSCNFSYISSISKANHMSFWSRGIRTTPHCQYFSAERIVEESDSEHDDTRYPGLGATGPGEKPRVVVLGTGWAACRFLKGLDTKVYDVICISPRNHMVFTPLLASTCVGTLEFRSVAEPVGGIQPALAKNPNSYFYLASCTGIDTDKHEVSETEWKENQLPGVNYCNGLVKGR